MIKTVLKVNVMKRTRFPVKCKSFAGIFSYSMSKEFIL